METITFTELNWIDYAIIVVITFFTIIGIVRGFVREAMSLLTWVTALIVGILFYEPIAEMFFSSISTVLIRYMLSFILLVLATLILGGIVNYLMGKLVKSTKSNLPDHIVGTLFGAAKGAAVVSISVLIINSFVVLQGALWRESLLVPKFTPASVWLEQQLPEMLRDVLVSKEML